MVNPWQALFYNPAAIGNWDWAHQFRWEQRTGAAWKVWSIACAAASAVLSPQYIMQAYRYRQVIW